ncbi:TPA: hypothetical protein ACWQBO_001349 [Escherichia coli]
MIIKSLKMSARKRN